MSFWNAVKKIAVAAKCTAGIHAGNWSKTPGNPDCQLQKTCPDCNKHVTTTKHVYGEWRYPNYASCEAVRECTHCGSVDQDVRHSYQKTGKNDECKIINRCIRCNHEELGREDHSWIKILDHEVKVGGKRKCKDCGVSE